MYTITQIDTKKILTDSRDEIASLFEDKYKGKITFSEVKHPVFSERNYWLTGFNIKFKGISRFIEVRMQIKENYDEKRRIHFARYIPESPQQNYFIAKIAFDIEKTQALLKNGEHVSSRHSYLMQHQFDAFNMPEQGFGIIMSFDNPLETGQRLLTIDNLIDTTFKNPCKDKFVMNLIAKNPQTYGAYK